MKKINIRLNIGIGLAIVSLALGLFNIPIQHELIAFGGNYGQGSDSDSGAKASTNQSSSNSIAITAKEIDEVYRWANASNSALNPELTFKLDTNNTVEIQNPTDTKHEFVIESQGEEVATSGDIGPNASGQVSFKPNMTGMFEYHCEYHPDTMKGTIKVSS